MAIFLFFFSSHAYSAECKTALVFNSSNKHILLDDKIDQVIYPASLTKLMTVYLAFDAIKHHKLKMNQILTASERVQEVAGVNKVNTLNLKVGDKISVEQAIKGAIVKSFNELTVMLAEEIAGNEWQFSRMMNMKAKELGMNFTNFRDSSGFHNFGHFSTDEDLLKLVLALKKNFPEYYHFFSVKEFNYHGQKYLSHNNILLNYKGAKGMKTGFTNIAGYNLISVARHDNKEIVAIITGCESSQKRDDVMTKLLDKSFTKQRGK